VVVKDVPADCTVVGVPGRIVDSRAGNSLRPQPREAGGISLDHNVLPDPVAKSIACLIDRIETLERELAELRHEAPPPEHSGQCQTCSAGDLCCEHESMH
jgi:serine O-acetyltransferase